MTSSDERTLREELTDICHRTYAHGFVAAAAGNASARLAGDLLLVSPSGASLGDLRPEDFVKVSLAGKPHAEGLDRGRPTSEL